MASIVIDAIDSAQSNLGGGYFINDNIYVDPVYIIKILWDEKKITITPPGGENIYIGDLDSIYFNGNSQPSTLLEVIQWLQVPQSHGRIKRKKIQKKKK